MTAEFISRGYVPLPQSISNTDTEDDDEHHENTHLNNQILQNSQLTTSNVSKNGRFYPLDETQNVANSLKNKRNTISYCNDEIPIMIIDGDVNNDLWKIHYMSPMRTLCLVISILLCVFTILLFLYALPCDDSVICIETVEPQSSLSWDQTLEGVELHGPISIVPGTPNNLIFLFRGQQYGGETSRTSNREPVSSDGGGVLSMQGNSGTVLWWVLLKRMPMDINCGVLDTDGSGKPDCLVSGKKGLLDSIEPTSGFIHWSSSLHTQEKLPVLLPDVNSDGISDLLSVEVDPKVETKNFVILSGNNGQLLARQKTECQDLELQILDVNLTVSYICRKSNGEQSTEFVPLHDLISTVDLHAEHKLTLNSQITSYNLTLSYKTKDNWEITPYYQLFVQNHGNCPSETCQISVNLTVKNAYNETRSIWDHMRAKSFAAKPAILNTTSQPYSVGFAVKFWQWTNVNLSSEVVRKIWTERVLLIYMNHTEVREINASQSEVVQLCRGDKCQPDLELQSHSIAIADLNNNGFSDLINYRTSYNFNHSKTLSSKVQIVKLDSFF